MGEGRARDPGNIPAGAVARFVVRWIEYAKNKLIGIRMLDFSWIFFCVFCCILAAQESHFGSCCEAVRGLEPIGFDLWEFDPESPQYIPFCFELPTNLRRPFGVRCCYNGFLTYIQDAKCLVAVWWVPICLCKHRKEICMHGTVYFRYRIFNSDVLFTYGAVF